MDEIIFLDRLKNLILLKVGIRTVTPADCTRIAAEISAEVKRCISVSTVKRLFGFAGIHYKFSDFTMLTLKTYVGEEIFGPGVSSKLNYGEETIDDWTKIHRNALKITQHTLDGIKSRPGIPFEHTINRRFADHDFEDFFDSHYSFTAFISQPGYGKTILLSHLAEKIIDNPIDFKNSTVLFLTAPGIFNTEQALSNLEDYLKARLSIHPGKSLVDYANENYSTSGGKLLIFLDGFSELVLKAENNILLFDSLINFICTIEDNNSIKLVLSMRTTTWIKFYECISPSAYLRSKWFRGNYFNPNEVTNVPQLSDKEVDLILEQNAHLNAGVIDAKLKKQLRLPLQIQFYYQLKQEEPGFNYSTNITFLELTTRFVTEKIYKSNNYTDKVLLLNKIMELTDYGRTSTSISKYELLTELNESEEAYIELLSEGILVEQRCYGEFHPTEDIHFINSYLFEYFLFVELLAKFDAKVDRSFFEYIDQEYRHSPLNFQLLQWTLKYIIKAADFEALSVFFQMDLNNYEKKYLILYIAENLDYRNKLSPKTKQVLEEYQLHQAILKVIVNLDFIDPYYQKAIEVLIRLTDDQELLATYHTQLLIFDILSMDSRKIRKRIDLLSVFNTTDRSLNIEIALWILSKLTGPRMQGNSLMEKIKLGISGKDPSAETPLPPNLATSYLLMILFTIFYSEPKDSLRIIRLIAGKHPGSSVRTSSFSVLVMSLFAYFSARIDPGKKTDQMEKVLRMLSSKAPSFKVPEYSGSIMKMVQIVQAKNKGDYIAAYDACMECLEVFRATHLHLNTIMIYNLVIEIFEEQNDHPKVNEYKYERLCFIDDHNISNAPFS